MRLLNRTISRRRPKPTNAGPEARGLAPAPRKAGSRRPARGRRGVAAILALLLLGIFAALGIAFAASTGSSFIKAANYSTIVGARLEAESGLSFCNYQFSQVSLAPGLSGQPMLAAMASALGARLNGTANLGGGSVGFDGNTITFPSIATPDGRRHFTTLICLADPNTLLVEVTGQDSNVLRAVGLKYNVVTHRSAVFDFGIAARGPVELTGNASVKGANSASEAAVLSAADGLAFSLIGNINMQGDISACDPSASVTLGGNVTIGGVKNGTGHIHVGVGDTDFPQVDPSVFSGFTTTNITSSTISGNKSFKNIRIKAGANTKFSGNITFQGIIYIEMPNNVDFGGNITLQGMVVTDDATNDTHNNAIKFSGNISTQGVETLPDTSDFHVLRQMPGSFILAPGFTVQFNGNFGTVNGCMAAESFSFQGNAGGTIRGGIISYSDLPFILQGNSSVTINRKNAPLTPPGFNTPTQVSALASTYTEY